MHNRLPASGKRQADALILFLHMRRMSVDSVALNSMSCLSWGVFFQDGLQPTTRQGMCEGRLSRW